MKLKKERGNRANVVNAADQVVFPEVTAIGIRIAKLDFTAWFGTDAVYRIHPDRDRMQYYVAYQDQETWKVAFGRIADDDACFLTAYEASGDITQTKPFKVQGFQEPRRDTGWLLQASLAIRDSQKVFPFHPAAETYNCVVLAEDDGTASVYWYPGTTNPDIRVLGADGVVHVRGQHDIKIVQYHKNLMQQPRKASDSMAAHTHFLIQQPVPLDVAYVMMGRPPEPSFVICEKQTYLIWKDGAIVALPQKPAQ